MGDWKERKRGGEEGREEGEVKIGEKIKESV